MSDDVAQAATAAERQTVRLPANLMALVRQSYDSREKVLDWMLALGVVGSLAWVFRDQLKGWCTLDPGPNAGRADEPQPNQDVAGAFRPACARPDLYTYNMPPARNVRFSIGPTMSPPPSNPASPPGYL